MAINIRPAAIADIDAISGLLVEDAKQRAAVDPDLWSLSEQPLGKIKSSISSAMRNESPPFRQRWLLAEVNGKAVGVTHSILLPVPPIYAGEFGPPGLIMEDCFIAPYAPVDTAEGLLEAAELDLLQAGAQILLASSIEGGMWADVYAQQGYDPLTMYFAKTGLGQAQPSGVVRKATAQDVPKIVTSSAINRRVLQDLHPTFWKPHADADDRFGSWMTRSLTLTDRDMFVSERDGHIQGYAISHPATPLHFPSPHNISRIGVIDDFYHDDLENAASLENGCDDAMALFEVAEAARAGRNDTSVLVVCPATWKSKIDLLERSDYRNAITWFIKSPSRWNTLDG